MHYLCFFQVLAASIMGVTLSGMQRPSLTLVRNISYIVCVYVRLYIYRGGGQKKMCFMKWGGQEKWNMAYLILHQPSPPPSK